MGREQSIEFYEIPRMECWNDLIPVVVGALKTGAEAMEACEKAWEEAQA